MRTAGAAENRRRDGRGARGYFPSGLPPFPSADLSPIKQVAFRPHELMLGAWGWGWGGFRLGEGTICSPPAEEGPPQQDSASWPEAQDSALWDKREGPARVKASIPKTQPLFRRLPARSNSGPPARLSGQRGADGVLPQGGSRKEGRGKERWAGWLQLPLLTSSREESQCSLGLGCGSGFTFQAQGSRCEVSLLGV